MERKFMNRQQLNAYDELNNEMGNHGETIKGHDLIVTLTLKKETAKWLDSHTDFLEEYFEDGWSIQKRNFVFDDIVDYVEVCGYDDDNEWISLDLLFKEVDENGYFIATDKGSLSILFDATNRIIKDVKKNDEEHVLLTYVVNSTTAEDLFNNLSNSMFQMGIYDMLHFYLDDEYKWIFNSSQFEFNVVYNENSRLVQFFF